MALLLLLVNTVNFDSETMTFSFNVTIPSDEELGARLNSLLRFVVPAFAVTYAAGAVTRDYYESLKAKYPLTFGLER